MIEIIGYNEGQEPTTISEACRVVGITKSGLYYRASKNGGKYSISTKTGDFDAPGWSFGLAVTSPKSYINESL